MTRVKICGITNIADALAAVDYGAQALGFIFVPESPRCIELTSGYEIGRCIPPFVSKVGVYKDWNDRINSYPENFDTFQYYSCTWATNKAEIVHGYNHRWGIRAYRMSGPESLNEIEATCSEADAILLDAYHPNKLGGSGECFNWDLAIEAKRFGKPIILAGGLNPENVEEAVVKVRPYAVDVSSGVETEPGRKDHEKLRAFIRAVQRSNV